MTDAQAWLTPYITRPSLSEPTRPYGPTETLHAGQVDDMGRIVGNAGERIGAGRIWIAHANLAAARYYGWAHAGSYATLCDGTTVVLVVR